jgi:hypothetical protein
MTDDNAALLETLKAEQLRREDAKIENGAAVRLPLTVVSHGEAIDDLVARAKAHKVAQLRQQGDGREVFFDEPLTIVTGVPRPAELPRRAWTPEPAAPQYPRRDDEHAIRSPAEDTEPMMPPPPVEWVRFNTVTRNPKDNDPGQIIEALYSVQGGLLAVKDLKNEPIGTAEIHGGDNVLAAARKLVREKRPSGFFGRLDYYFARGIA